MHVNKAKVINCLILSPLVCQKVLWTSFSQMYGDLPQHLLDVLITMFPSLMITASALGYISFAISLKFFSAFKIFRILLNANLIVKF